MLRRCELRKRKEVVHAQRPLCPRALRRVYAPRIEDRSSRARSAGQEPI